MKVISLKSFHGAHKLISGQKSVSAKDQEAGSNITLSIRVYTLSYGKLNSMKLLLILEEEKIRKH